MAIYVPKYTDLFTVRAAVSPLADEVEDEIVAGAIQSGEREVEDFLEACDLSLEALTTVQKNAARDLATYRSVLILIPRLPVEIEKKRELYTHFKELRDEAEELFLRRIFMVKKAKAVYKRIPTDEKFYEE